MGLRTKNGRNRAGIYARRGEGTRTHAPRTRTGVRRTTRPGPAACVRVRGAKYSGLTRHAHFPGSGVRRFPLAVTKSGIADSITRFTAKTYHKALVRGAKFLAFSENSQGVKSEILKALENSREKLEEIYARCFQQTDLLYNI